MHISPDFGLPYANAGITPDGTQATATCPICDEVFKAKTPKAAARLYGEHFAAAERAEANA